MYVGVPLIKGCVLGGLLVTEEYNEHLVFNPEDSKLFFSIREPIVNRVFSSSRQRGFASR